MDVKVINPTMAAAAEELVEAIFADGHQEKLVMCYRDGRWDDVSKHVYAIVEESRLGSKTYGDVVAGVRFIVTEYVQRYGKPGRDSFALGRIAELCRQLVIGNDWKHIDASKLPKWLAEDRD